MRNIDRRSILVLALFGLVLGFVGLVVWFVSDRLSADDATATATPAVSQSAAPDTSAGQAPPTVPEMPAFTHEVEGMDDYSSVLTDVPEDVNTVVRESAETLVPWTQGQTVESRRDQVDDRIPEDLVGQSPFEVAYGDVEGASVTVDDLPGATVSQASGDGESVRMQVAQPVNYTLRLPKGDGEETTAYGQSTWLFTVEIRDGEPPRIVEVTEPSGL